MRRPVFEIPHTCNGPSESGNGGYTAGRFASFLNGPHTIRIMKPIPLDTPMEIVETDERVYARAAGEDILMARPTTLLPQEIPAPPVLEDVRAAMADPISFGADGFSSCLVCGRNRDTGDGLRIWCGPLEEGVAHLWVPHANFCDGDGKVKDEYLWGALDCPGAFSLPDTARNVLLGEITAEIYDRPKVGNPVTIAAWRIAGEGRKHTARTVLYAESGAPLAQSETLWIELTDAQMAAMA